jgi:hypothetical protein
MKIAKHICFFYKEERLQYINKILEETAKYPFTTDVFIHTHKKFSKDKLVEYTNGSLNIIFHDLSGIHPFYLPSLTRNLLKEQRNDYDIFIYVEDDILIPTKAIKYWLHYKDNLIKNNYNLGFVRIEIDDKGEEHITDICHSPDMSSLSYLTKNISIEKEEYVINDKNPYCAFWIYDKQEFNKFVDSKYYDIKNVSGYDIRAVVAIGLHGVETDWYKGTVIPIKNNQLVNECKVYHLPNNYVHREGHWICLKFNDVVKI